MSGRIPDQYVRFPVNLQTWEHPTFLHWSYDPAVVQAFVPEELTVQQWDGCTWVGITPFVMTNVRVPGLSPLPGWGAVAGLNIRTYVRTHSGRDGIWFLGLLAPVVSYVAATRSLGLPYRRAEAEVVADGTSRDYRFGSPRSDQAQSTEWFDATVQVGEQLTEAQRTPLLESITGRWTAFHRRAGVMWGTPVYHDPWELHAASAGGNLTAPLRWAGLPDPESEPVVHASYTVHSRLGMPLRV